MAIRAFQPGDEAAQVSIYNEAAAGLPFYKPATHADVSRRTKAHGFDPQTRFYAILGDEPVGYTTFQTNGRVGFPWCRKGHEHLAEPLFAHVLGAMKDRGIKQAFAAYRADWKSAEAFFLAHGFQKAREIVNYYLDLVEMPTPSLRRTQLVTPLEPRDIPELMQLNPAALRISSEVDLANYLFKNPYFAPTSLFGLRTKEPPGLAAVGILILDPAFADPTKVDSSMPCFRHGAFGTEGMTTKRINGLFSFLAADRPESTEQGMTLLRHAGSLLVEADGERFGAQVSTDVVNLRRFYEHYFRRQGGFPVFERTL